MKSSSYSLFRKLIFISASLIFANAVFAQGYVTPDQILAQEIKNKIKTDFNFTVLDNSKLTSEAAQILYHAISRVPRTLIRDNLRVITIKSYYLPPHGTSTSEQFDAYVKSLNLGAKINLFPYSDKMEGPLPYDTSGKTALRWFNVIYHELNHNVWGKIRESAADGIMRQLELYNRTLFLIQNAGAVADNYIRGHAPFMQRNPAYFLDKPIEFIASTANDYFNDSEVVLKHSVDKFLENENLNLISQYLLMLDIYTRGTLQGLHYQEVGTKTIKRAVTVVRNSAGRVTGLTTSTGRVYRFRLSPKGLVLRPIQGDFDLDGVITAIDAAMLNSHLTGAVLLKPMQLRVADFNRDGTVNAADVTAMLNSAVSL